MVLTLDWPQCRNVRDLGGLPTREGGFIRSGALIRADCLDRLTPEGREAFDSHGVCLILDLRSVGEGELPHPFADDPRYRGIPLIDPRRERSRAERAGRTLGMIYSTGLDRNARSIMEGVAAVADAPEGAVVIHCAVGKDRTGMMVALLLSLVGVADEVIAADYALSARFLRDEFAPILAGLDGAEREHMAERMGALPESIQQMLGRMREDYGDAEKYFAAHGLSADQIDRLRRRLLA